MTDLEKEVNEINKEYFLPALTEELWKEDFESEEYIQANRFLKAYLSYFNKIDLVLLIQVFKSMILYLKWVLGNVDEADEDTLRISGQTHQQYINMVPEFIRVMRSFQFAQTLGNTKKDIDFEEKTGLFDITKITFEGKRKNKIILEGEIIDIVRAMFDFLGNITTEEQMIGLKFLAQDLHDTYYDLWFSKIAKLSKVKSPNRPIKGKAQFLSFLKTMRAYQLHRFLKDFSTITEGEKITEKEKRFIGDFFINVGLCQDKDEKLPNYLDTVHYNDVRNWIIRGTH